MKWPVLIAGLVLATLLGGCAVTGPGQAGANRLVTTMARAERAYANGNWLGARDEYLAIVARVPDHVPALFRLGNIAQRLDSLPEARRHYERVVALEPEHAKAHYNLSMVLALQARNHHEQAAGLAGAAIPSSAALDRALGPSFRLDRSLGGAGSGDNPGAP